MKREHAYKLRKMLHKASVSLSDVDALDAVELFPAWAVGTAYTVDQRIRYDGILYRCLQAHTSQETWTPTDAPSLWARVLIPDPEVIPEWVQPDSTNPYMKGDKVWYPDKSGTVYQSLIDNNIWSPEAYPAGWEALEQ